MIIRWQCVSALIVVLVNVDIAFGSLNFTKLNPDLPDVELKQHRHSMDQLEPDLAQTIFNGIQKNPLERTTARPKIVIVKSPTLRGKRQALLNLKPANVKLIESEDTQQMEYDNINADFNEDAPSEAIEASTDVSFVIEETANLSGEKAQTEKIIDAELAVVTSAPDVSLTTMAATDAVTPVASDVSTTASDAASRVGTTLIQEVAPPTPKYNITQNDNSPTENLDRKILAFEIDSHNKKVFEELQKRKAAAASAAADTNAGEHEMSAFSFEVEEKREITSSEAAAAMLMTTATTISTPSVPVSTVASVVTAAPLVSSTTISSVATDASPVANPEIPAAGSTPAIATLAPEVPPTEELPLEPVVTLTAELQPTQPPILDTEIESIDRIVEPPPAIESSSDLPTAANSKLPHEGITQLTELLPESSTSSLPDATPALTDGEIVFHSAFESAAIEAAAAQAKLQAEAIAAKVIDPASQTSLQSPPPPKDLPGFLIPNRPILDSTVQKRRHLISNYVDPLQQQLAIQLQQQREQKEEFFRRAAVIARLRSKRGMNETEQQEAEVTIAGGINEDIIDEADSGEPKADVIGFLENSEAEIVTASTFIPETTESESTTIGEAEAEATTSEASEVILKLVTKKSSSNRAILDDEATKTIEIHESSDSTPSDTDLTTLVASEVTDSTPESEDDSTTISPSDEGSTPTEPPQKQLAKEALIANALTREEKIALLESMTPRRGVNLGNIPAPKKPEAEPIDASAETPGDDHNPWSNRFKTHIQLKLTDESREVVEGSSLKVWPKLSLPEKKEKAKKNFASNEAAGIHDFEFKDLPQPRDADVKISNDLAVTKPATRPATLVATTAVPATTPRLLVPQQQPQFQQFGPQQVQTQFPQAFFTAPQQPQLPRQRVIIIEGRRYVFQDSLPPPQFQQPRSQFQFPAPPIPQQQFFQSPRAAPPAPSPPPPTPRPINHPSLLQNPTPARSFISTTKPPRVIHSGNAKTSRSSSAPGVSESENLGPHVRQEDLTVVRIFQHRGTTRAIFATAPTTQPPITTTTPKPVTDETTEWIPVTYTTYPTPTQSFDEHLVSTPSPVSSSRVKTVNEFFEVYDEVETSDPTTKQPTPKRDETTMASRKSSEEHVISEISLAGAAPARRSEKPETFQRDLPLRPPPRDPPPLPSPLSARKQPKLIRITTGAAPTPNPVATDFQGDAPMAKPDLRGLDTKIITIS